NGQVAFQTTSAIQTRVFISSPLSIGSSCGTIFRWSTLTGMSKVVAVGDPTPVAARAVNFSCVTLTSPPNNSGQLAFIGQYSGDGVPISNYVGYQIPFLALSSVSGVFVAQPGGAIEEIVATNDTLPGATSATTRVPTISVPLNEAG